MSGENQTSAQLNNDKNTGLYTINTTRRLEDHTVYYSVSSNGQGLLEMMPNLNIIAILVLALTIPLLMIVTWAFYRYVSKPVFKLIKASKHIEEGDLGYNIDKMPNSYEFKYLFESFNSMSKQLKYHFERSYMEQLALQDARIKALQSQINPHFLNNTLEIISWEARMADCEKIWRMIEALSTLLNTAMARDDKSLVNLSEELIYVDAYLYIISVRFGKRLEVSKYVDDGLLDYQVPRIILQPIVENAIDHGVSKAEKGKLELRIYKEGKYIVMEVENNSILLDEDKKAIDHLLKWDGNKKISAEAGHIGIRNVNQRLKILYGEDCGLTIMSTEGGTLARIVVPCQTENATH